MPSNIVAPLAVSDQDREQLERMARSTSLPHRNVRHAKAFIWGAEGVPNAEVARRCRVDPDAVRAWRRRFEEKALPELALLPKAGAGVRGCPTAS
jgi:Helix-turn-helix domain